MTPRYVRLLVAGLAVLAVAACGGPAAPEAAAPAPDTGGAFPVTIPHTFGETTIPAEPQRVVTLGFNEADFALALGVVPVGVRDFIGDFPEETRPWAQEALAGAQPENLGDEIDYERLAGLRPDLILATYSFIEQADYDKLAAIAPTVGPVTADGNITWQEELRVAGEALGRSERAAEVRAETERTFAEAAAAHPEFAGRSLALAFFLDAGQYFVLEPSDPRAQFFGELGFTDAARSGEISVEQASLLENDVLAVLGVDESALADDELFQRVPVVSEGRTVFFGGFERDFGGALGFGSPLSLQYAVDLAVPRLAAAVDGDPATSTDG